MDRRRRSALARWSDNTSKRAALEAFVVANLAFLALDVYLAHAVNRFRHPAEWIPFWFSIAATLLLVPVWLPGARAGTARFVRGSGYVVGVGSIAVGLAGVVYHLDSQFLSLWTVASLVYTAPFAAPLAYAGLGFLLLLNRMVPADETAWGQWVVVFALGGFVGNFVLSLCDHAMNGFFYTTEWIPVGASALAVGFLAVALVERDRRFLFACVAVLALQVLVGLAGFAWHLAADISGLSASRFDSFIHGAPVFAPLLFVDLVVLALVGLWEPLLHATPAPET